MHAGVARRILHLIELSLLRVELLLDLRYPFKLSRLIPVVRPLGLNVPVRRLNRRMELVDPRLQGRHSILLRQDLGLPLFSRTLLRQSLLRQALVG